MSGDAEGRHYLSVSVSELSVRVVYDDQVIRKASLPCDGRESSPGKEFRPVVGGDNSSDGWHDGCPSYQGD